MSMMRDRDFMAGAREAGGTARGAAPVARLEDLPPIEASAVMLLRAVCEAEAEASAGDGPEGAALDAIGALVAAAVAGARRPLARHAAECACVGADERALAAMIAAAADGEREEAMLLAVLIARPEAAPEIATLAERAGIALRRLAVRLGRGRAGPALH